MRRRIPVLICLVLALGAAALFWSRRTQPHVEALPRPRPRIPPPAVESQEQALETSGRVVGLAGPVALARIIVTRELPDSLSAQPCPGENATVRLLDFECRDGSIEELVLASLTQGRGDVRVVLEATADDRGVFKLPLTKGGDFAVWAWTEDQAGAAFHVRPGERDIEVVVTTGARLRGHVQDESGQPVSAATIVAVHADHSRAFPATSAADGSFEIPFAPVGSYYVVASHQGNAPDVRFVRTGWNPILTLKEAHAVRVLVTDHGEPVSNALVELETKHSVKPQLTDTHGEAGFDAIWANWIRGTAVRGERVGRLKCELAARATPCTVALGPSISIDVLCVDEGGSAVPGAKVEVEGSSGGKRGALSDDQGRAHFGPLWQAEYWVRATAEGRLPASEHIGQPAPGEAAVVILRLLRGVSLSGVVLDKTGSPVAGAALKAYPSMGIDGEALRNGRGRSATPRGDAVSRPDGHFTIGPLDTGPYTLHMGGHGYVADEVGVIPPKDGLILTLKTGATVRGRVVHSNGRPVEEGHVTIQLEGEDDHRGHYAMIGALGLFEIGGVPEGKYVLQAANSISVDVGDTGPFSNQVKRQSITVAGGEAWVDVAFDPAFEIAGRVLDENGNPVADATVSAEPEKRPPGDGSGGAALSDANGAFLLGGLKEVPYRIHVSKSGWKRDDKQVTARAPSSDVRIVLRHVSSLKGRLVDKAQKPVTTFNIGEDAFHSEDGTFSLPTYGEDERVLHIRAPGFSPRELVVDDRGGAVDLGNIEMARGSAFKGVVRDAVSGRPLGGVLVTFPFERSSGFFLCSSLEEGGTTSDSNGRFELENVVSGTKKVCFEHPRYIRHFTDVADVTQVATVSLDPGTQVFGEVLDARGKGVSGISMDATEEGGLELMRYAETDTEGAYELSGLEVGTYVIQPRREGEKATFTAARITVSGQGRQRLDFKTRADGATLRVITRSRKAGGEAKPFLMGGVVTQKPQGVAFYEGTATAIPEDTDGAGFIYRALEPGQYTLWVRGERGWYVRSVTLSGTTDQVAEIDLGSPPDFVSPE